MGVDIKMFAWIPKVLNDDELREASYRIVDAIGHDFFWINREKEQHALTFVNSDKEYYQLPQIKGGIFIEVNTLYCYYGPDYERGDFKSILAVVKWLQFALKARVFYGGDSDNILDEWTPEFEFNITSHWATVGRFPYTQDRSILVDSIEMPICDLCKHSLIRNGWGTNYAMCWCPCGLSMKTIDNGKTWEIIKRGD